MNVKLTGKLARTIVPAAVACLLWAGPALAAEYWLCAGAMTKLMPDPDGSGPLRGQRITMWGFALDNNNDLSDGCGTRPRVPGPELVVPDGDATGLTVHLRNDLPLLNRRPVRVSILIPGQAAGTGGAPAGAFFTDAQGRQRARSFTVETPRRGVRTYTWPAFRPGTYLYMSGTHPALQVQMGLYGMARRDAGPGTAYAGVPYDQQVTLLYSEIDPALHRAVAGNLYGPGPAMTVHSTLNYRPSYFLVNGRPFARGVTPNIPAGAAGSTTLIRFLNAGLQEHVPVVQEAYLRLVAEDGNPATYPAERYSVPLPAGKTVDALFTPAAAGVYPVYDRRLSLTNRAQTPGGLLSFLEVAPSAP